MNGLKEICFLSKSEEKPLFHCKVLKKGEIYNIRIPKELFTQVKQEPESEEKIFVLKQKLRVRLDFAKEDLLSEELELENVQNGVENDIILNFTQNSPRNKEGKGSLVFIGIPVEFGRFETLEKSTYNPPSFGNDIVDVRICRLRDIDAFDPNGFSDPYVTKRDSTLNYSLKSSSKFL